MKKKLEYLFYFIAIAGIWVWELTPARYLYFVERYWQSNGGNCLQDVCMESSWGMLIEFEADRDFDCVWYVTDTELDCVSVSLADVNTDFNLFEFLCEKQFSQNTFRVYRSPIEGDDSLLYYLPSFGIFISGINDKYHFSKKVLSANFYRKAES